MSGSQTRALIARIAALLKRISSTHRKWLLRHQRRSAERRLFCTRVAQEIRREKALGILMPQSSAATVEAYRRGKQRFVQLRGEATPLPSVFCFDRNRDETLAFIEGLRRRTRDLDPLRPLPDRRQRRAGAVALHGYSKFETLKSISTSAALVLVAEFDRIQALKHVQMSAINLRQWDPNVRAFLANLGFLELLGVDREVAERQYSQSEDGVAIVKFQRGDTLDPESSGRLTDLLADMIERCGVVQDLTERNLYGALVEAMENAVRWAYPQFGTYAFEPLRCWWMTGAVDAPNRRLTVALYDQGVSIPATLPKWDQFPAFQTLFRRAFGRNFSLLGTIDDALALRTAVKVAKTSSGLTHHGKGLSVFKDVVDKGVSGHLRIMSRRGDYLYRKGGRPQLSSLPTDIGGTLVEWEVLF